MQFGNICCYMMAPEEDRGQRLAIHQLVPLLALAEDSRHLKVKWCEDLCGVKTNVETRGLQSNA